MQEHFPEFFFASSRHSSAQTDDLLPIRRKWDSVSSLSGRFLFTRAAAAAVSTSRDAHDPLQQIADTEAAAAVVTADATLFWYLRLGRIVWRWRLASGRSLWRWRLASGRSRWRWRLASRRRLSTSGWCLGSLAFDLRYFDL